jgi:hypothetical protein
MKRKIRVVDSQCWNEADFARWDEIELQAMLEHAEAQIAARQTISQPEVKARIAARKKAVAEHEATDE